MDRAVSMEVRKIEEPDAAELYITAVPDPEATLWEQAEHTFAAIAEALVSAGASVFQERIFAVPEAFDEIMAARSRHCASLVNGVPPARLRAPKTAYGAFAGVQLHAVSGCGQPRPLGSPPFGRILEHGGRRYVSISGLAASDGDDAPGQARAMFERAARAVEEAGGNMSSVVRTWIWLRDILAWYDEFNEVRTDFFKACGLIRDNVEVRLPASTGIGIAPAVGGHCAMDLFAVIGGEETADFLLAGGRQQAAYEYGSAFSRAARSRTPAGEAVLVSGTASIDAEGNTVHLDDPEAQIQATIDNVRAVLDETGCADDDVVQAVAYCKTPEVERLFRSSWNDVPWPRVVAVADICREELLFEIEATAVPKP